LTASRIIPGRATPVAGGTSYLPGARQRRNHPVAPPGTAGCRPVCRL